jgi:hypothetical protein
MSFTVSPAAPRFFAAHHVPERPRRPRLVIANTGIDQDIVVQRLYDEALHA